MLLIYTMILTSGWTIRKTFCQTMLLQIWLLKLYFKKAISPKYQNGILKYVKCLLYWILASQDLQNINKNMSQICYMLAYVNTHSTPNDLLSSYNMLQICYM